ncbi:hypothetical protein HAX54_040585, partial [Datura stramonium]|nr:hypothetical protein [Datura stramonium]
MTPRIHSWDLVTVSDRVAASSLTIGIEGTSRHDGGKENGSCWATCWLDLGAQGWMVRVK